MKYCPMCGIDNIDNAAFCKNCGLKFEEMIAGSNQPTTPSTNQNITPQYYAQPYPYTPQTPPKSKKPIIAVAVVAIAAILVIALLFMSGIFGDGFLGETNDDPNEYKTEVAGGPTASLQSIATGGNALTTPASGHTAVYGYYMDGTRIGSLSYTNMGQEYYQGELCNKIEGGGNFDFGIYSSSIDMNFDIEGYEAVSDLSLRYCNYDFSVGYESYSIDMEGTVSVDKENGEITSTAYNSMTGTVSTTFEVPDDFWTKTNLQDNLYVGYSDELTYTSIVSGYETPITLRISVTGQEDVTVEKGTFEDCYIVKIEQGNGVFTTTSYMWIDEDNVCPKMEISNSAASLGYGELVIELEEYYTT